MIREECGKTTTALPKGPTAVRTIWKQMTGKQIDGNYAKKIFLALHPSSSSTSGGGSSVGNYPSRATAGGGPVDAAGFSVTHTVNAQQLTADPLLYRV